MKLNGVVCYFSKMLVLGGVLLPFSSAKAVSFDCAKASTIIEKAICTNPELSALDDQLAAIYKATLKEALAPDDIKASQRKWTQSRNTCKAVSCIKQAYLDRIMELEGDTVSPNLEKQIVKTEPMQFSGRIEEYRDAGMWFVRLVDDQGKEIVHLGGLGLMPEEASECVGNAMDDGSIVQISGNTQIYTDGSRAMEAETLTCKAVDSPVQDQNSMADFWVQRNAQEQKDEIILGLCINETDDCGNLVIKKGSRPFSFYQKNADLFRTGLVFRATFNQDRVITGIVDPFPLEHPTPIPSQKVQPIQPQQSPGLAASKCDEAEQQRLVNLWKSEFVAYVNHLKAVAGDYPTIEQQMDMASKVQEWQNRFRYIFVQANANYEKTKDPEEICRAIRTLVGETKKRP